MLTCQYNVQVKKDHETRIAALTKAEEECITKAQLIEANVEDVDAAIKYLPGTYLS